MFSIAFEMKLKELAEIKQGIEVPENRLVRGIAPSIDYFRLLTPSDFEGAAATYIAEKELKKRPIYSRSLALEYGDYLLYWTNSGPKLRRYENQDRKTVPSHHFFILRSSFSILPDFLGIESNKSYFFDELRKFENTGTLIPTLDQIGSIEIGAENIRELEEANEAERIGIHQPLDPSLLPLNIAQKPITIDKLLKRIQHDELLLDTEFQRRPGLWDIGVKSRLIESMVVRLPIPAFYFDGGNDDEWLIIDGLQRLSAVRDFVCNGFSLEGMVFLPELEGKTFDQLPRSHQRNIEEYEVFAYILQKGTHKSIAYRIFKNINTSALALESQEIRHALNPGVPSKFLKDVAETDWFKNAVPLSPRLRDRMEDRENVLRFVAFQLKGYADFKPSIVEFLDAAMTKMYEMPASKQTLFKEEFESILNCLVTIFDMAPFSRSLFDQERKAYVHNNIMFELLTFGIAKVPIERRATFASRVDVKETILSHFKSRHARFWDYEDAYSSDGLRRRFQDIESLIRSLNP